MSRMAALLILIAALTGTPLRQAEAAADLCRSLVESARAGRACDARRRSGRRSRSPRPQRARRRLARRFLDGLRSVPPSAHRLRAGPDPVRGRMLPDTGLVADRRRRASATPGCKSSGSEVAFGDGPSPIACPSAAACRPDSPRPESPDPEQELSHAFRLRSLALLAASR